MSEPLLLPLPQSMEFARCCKALGAPIRVCKRESGGQTQLRWQVQSRKLALFGRVDLISRGPVARDPGDLDDWLDRWQHWHDGRPLLLNAENMAAETLRGAGFWPLITPATVGLVPLSARGTMRKALQQKWRNRLVRGEHADLRVTRHALSPGHWLLEAERIQARTKRYRGMPPSMFATFARTNPGKAVVFEARHNGKTVAGALMLRHGAMATWQIGFSKPLGRKLNAMNVVLFEAMGWLADQGHQVLDLGAINKVDAPGLAHFKLGTGAIAHQLSGTWLHMGPLAPIARRLPHRLAA